MLVSGEACPLTPKQWDALRALSDGMSPVEAATLLMISPASMYGRTYQARMLLEVPTTIAAVRVCRSNGWLEHRPEGVEEPISPAWHGYLAAFDAHLYARGDVEQLATRLLMDVSLRHALGRRAPTNRCDKAHNLVDLIQRTIKENR